MVHAGTKAKKHLNLKSRAQLIAVIMYMLTILKFTNPKAYKSAEKRLGLTGKLVERKHRKQRGGIRTHETKKRRPPKNWKMNLRKAIRANPRMSASAKRKALAKLK